MQLSLWANLPLPDRLPATTPPPKGVLVSWRVAVQVLLILRQRPLPMVLRRLESDVDTEFDFPTRQVVSAALAPAVVTVAVPSIFALADAMKAAKQLRKQGRFGDAAGFKTTAPRPIVTRDGGALRVQGAAYPSNRWTEERAEHERIRRAKQRPPKPPKGAKTRGKKVRRWDGEGGDT